MHRFMVIVVLSVLIFAPADLRAQSGTVRQACRAEIEQHCAGVQPGEGRLRACVKEHFGEFSEPCKAALLSSVE